MFQSQILMTDSIVEVYSPWSPRSGDHGRFTVDVVSVGQSGGGAAEIAVRAWTKRADDTGEGADADTTVSIVRTTVGRTTQEWISTTSTGFKDLVRYKFSISNTSDMGTVWVLFRMLPPVWFDAVKA